MIKLFEIGIKGPSSEILMTTSKSNNMHHKNKGGINFRFGECVDQALLLYFSKDQELWLAKEGDLQEIEVWKWRWEKWSRQPLREEEEDYL